MPQYRFGFSRRLFIMNRTFFLVLLITFIGIIYFSLFISSRTNRLPSYRRPWSLVQRQTILVPVHISHLYDYRVVCSGQEGILDQIKSIEQCRIDVNKTWEINLQPPPEFQNSIDDNRDLSETMENSE